MVKTITLRELRSELSRVINGIDEKLDRYIIVKGGKPVAVMMSVDDYESLMETLEILSDKKCLKRIRIAKKEIGEGNTVPLKALRKKLEDV